MLFLATSCLLYTNTVPVKVLTKIDAILSLETLPGQAGGGAD